MKSILFSGALVATIFALSGCNQAPDNGDSASDKNAASTPASIDQAVSPLASAIHRFSQLTQNNWCNTK